MKILSKEDIKRLSRMNGMRFDKWKNQEKLTNEHIDELLSGDVSEAFTKCLPHWLTLGRVNDTSLGLKAPQYHPHNGTVVGRLFTEKFYQSHSFLINKLADYNPTSAEYLCVCDLIIGILEEYNLGDRRPIPIELLSLRYPVPDVLRIEYKGFDWTENHMDNLGDFYSVLIEHLDD